MNKSNITYHLKHEITLFQENSLQSVDQSVRPLACLLVWTPHNHGFWAAAPIGGKVL